MSFKLTFLLYLMYGINGFSGGFGGFGIRISDVCQEKKHLQGSVKFHQIEKNHMMLILFNAVNNKECHLLLLISSQLGCSSAVSLAGISSMC